MEEYKIKLFEQFKQARRMSKIDISNKSIQEDFEYWIREREKAKKDYHTF